MPRPIMSSGRKAIVSTDKELLVYVRGDATQIMILVPRKRGEGFAKMPFGHHSTALSQIESEIGYDIFGLDGSLNIQTGYFRLDKKKELLALIMPPLCKHYGIGYREVGEEFWDLHPIRNALR